jgi:hypothetical protein
MMRQHWLRDLLYSHLVASYVTGIAIAAWSVHFNLQKFFTGAIIIFLSPTLISILALLDPYDQGHGVSPLAIPLIYLPAFAVIYIFLRWRRKRHSAKLIQEHVLMPESAPIVLDYFNAVPETEPPMERTEKLAIAAMIATIIMQALVCARAIIPPTNPNSPANGTRAIDILLYIALLLPSSVTIIISFAGGLPKMIGKRRRANSFACLCVGIFGFGLMLMVILSRIYPYD